MRLSLQTRGSGLALAFSLCVVLQNPSPSRASVSLSENLWGGNKVVPESPSGSFLNSTEQWDSHGHSVQRRVCDIVSPSNEEARGPVDAWPWLRLATSAVHMQEALGLERSTRQSLLPRAEILGLKAKLESEETLVSSHSPRRMGV